MATAVGLNMKITADTAGIGRGMNRTERMLAGLSKSANSAAGSLRSLVAIEVGTRLASAFAGAAKAAVAYANGLAKSVDETAKVAQRTGIAVEALQGFQVAASLSGVQNLEGALQKVSVVLGDAAAGSATAQKAFTNIGLSVDELMGMAPEDQFRAVAAAISQIQDPAARAAAAVDLFGRSGVELLPLFASNLEEVEARAKRLGIVLGDDQTSAIEEMNDALDLVGKTFDGIIGQVTGNLADVVTGLAEEFLSFVESFESFTGESGGSGIAEVITNALFSAADYLAQTLDPWLNTLLEWGDSFSSSTSQLGQWFEYFQTVVDLLQGAFYSARAIFNVFLLGLAEWAKMLAGWFSKSLKEGISTFQDGLAESIKQDAQRAMSAFSGDRGSQESGSGARRIGSIVDRSRERFANRNSPEMQAERERKKAEMQLAREQAAAAKKAAKAAADAKRLEDERLKKIQQVDDKIASVEEERGKRAAEIEASRLENLSQASTQALNVGDVRSGGISEILRIAAGREDPAIEEYRKQLSELRKIEGKLAELAAEKVEILGGGKGRAA